MYLNVSVMYVLYANNMSNNTATMTSEPLNYNNFESVFIISLRKLCYFFIGGYTAGMINAMKTELEPTKKGAIQKV